MTTKAKKPTTVGKDASPAIATETPVVPAADENEATTTAAVPAASKKKTAAPKKKSTTVEGDKVKKTPSTEKRPRSDPLLDKGTSSYINKILADGGLKEGSLLKRERRPVTRTTIEAPEEAQKKKNLPMRSGSTLLDYNPDLEHKFAHLKQDEKDVLSDLHKIIFTRVGKANENLKRNILSFQGFDLKGEKKEYNTEILVGRIVKQTKDELKSILKMLLLPSQPTKDQSVDLLLKYLTTPSKVEHIEYEGPKKKSDKKKKATDKKKTTEKKKSTEKKSTEKKSTDKKSADKKSSKKSSKKDESEDEKEVEEEVEEEEEEKEVEDEEKPEPPKKETGKKKKAEGEAESDKKKKKKTK